MLTIDSAQNASFKKYLSLTGAKGLKKEGLFLLSGEKLVREFLKKPNLSIVSELVTAKLKPLTKNAAQLSTALFNEIDVLGTHFNILVLKQPEIDVIEISQHKPRGIEVVLPVGDPGNLGALLRSCEAFGVERVILTQEAAHPFLPKSVKASAGSALRIGLLQGPALKDIPAQSMALDMQGTSLYSFRWPKDGLLVVGEEGAGLSQHFKQRISIPTKNVESLNAVVAASIALAHKSSTST